MENDCDVESLHEASDYVDKLGGEESQHYATMTRKGRQPDRQENNTDSQGAPSEERKRRKKRIIKKIVKKKASDGTYITELTTTTLKRDGSRNIIKEIKRYDSEEAQIR